MPDGSRDLPPLVGEARCFVDMLEHVSQVAPTERPVLVIGERGTGKELIAARLHFLSGRWERPFVKVNCASLSEELLDSELFGHEAGAFTGAVRRHVGRFERADTGTLFLDEIANASLRVQEKILRVIEYGEFERVGGSTTLTVDVRVIGATNLDLPGQVSIGRFRADLLDRLAFDVLTLPPLRARLEDIPLLAEHFALGMASELGKTSFAGFTASARDLLASHSWPGNVRELKNTVERAVHRAPRIDRPIADIALDPFASPYRPLRPAGDVINPAPPEDIPAPTELGVGGPFDLLDRVRSFERELLAKSYEKNRYNQRKTAEFLGMTYHQLRRHLKKHDMVNLRNS